MIEIRRQTRNRVENLNSENNFSRWRAILGYHQDTAAEKLGRSKSAVEAYDRGERAPDQATRILMRLYAEGKDIPEPWPE